MDANLASPLQASPLAYSPTESSPVKEEIKVQSPKIIEGDLSVPVMRIINAIAFVLQHDLELGDGLFFGQEYAFACDIFQSLHACPVSIRDYLIRIVKYGGFSESCLLSALIYLERYKLFTRDDQKDVRPINFLYSRNAHRLVAMAIMAAVKFQEDVFWTSETFAKIFGLTVTEMIGLELEFILRLNWTLYIAPNTYSEYCHTLAQIDMNLCQSL